MRVLESFGHDARSLSVSEIAARAGLPMSTAHRIVTDMVAHGLLSRDEAGRVNVGMRLWEISQHSSVDLELRQAALPLMENLQAIVKQHTQLAVLLDDEVLYLERLSTRGAVGNIAQIATRMPPYACSPGLVFLAYGPETLSRRVLTEPLKVYTPQSLSDVGRVRRAIAFVRRYGYAVAPGYAVEGSKGIAVPIWGHTQHPIGALSIVVALDYDHRHLVPALLATARGISTLMRARHDHEEPILRQRNPLPKDASDTSH